MQGHKSIFLKKQFSEFSSVVVQYTKTVNSIRDEIEENGDGVNAGDLEIGQSAFNILILRYQLFLNNLSVKCHSNLF